MDMFLIGTYVLIAFTVGLIVGGGLSLSVIEELRDLLAHLIDDPNDEATRAIVRTALYQNK